MVELLKYLLGLAIVLTVFVCAAWFLRDGLPKALAYCNILQGPAKGPKWLYLAGGIVLLGVSVAVTIGFINLLSNLLESV